MILKPVEQHRKRTTNYQEYFGTPEKAACMQIHSGMDGFEIYRYDIDTMNDPEPVAEIRCDPDDPAALYEWMNSERGA